MNAFTAVCAEPLYSLAYAEGTRVQCDPERLAEFMVGKMEFAERDLGNVELLIQPPSRKYEGTVDVYSGNKKVHGLTRPLQPQEHIRVTVNEAIAQTDEGLLCATEDILVHELKHAHQLLYENETARSYHIKRRVGTGVGTLLGGTVVMVGNAFVSGIVPNTAMFEGRSGDVVAKYLTTITAGAIFGGRWFGHEMYESSDLETAARAEAVTLRKTGALFLA